jgi:hypothetical protein
LLWEELESALISIASAHRKTHATGAAARFLKAARKRYVIARAFSRAALREAHLHHHQLQSGLSASLADTPIMSRSSGPGSLAEVSVMSEVSDYSPNKGRPLVKMSGSVALAWPTGKELHQDGDHAPLTFAEVLRFLPLLGVSNAEVAELARIEQPTFSQMQAVAEAHGGTLKDVGRLRKAVLEAATEEEAQADRVRHGERGLGSTSARLHKHISMKMHEAFDANPKYSNKDVVTDHTDAIASAMNATRTASRGPRRKSPVPRGVKGRASEYQAEDTSLSAAKRRSSFGFGLKRRSSEHQPRLTNNSTSEEDEEGETAVSPEPRLLPLTYTGAAYFLRAGNSDKGALELTDNVRRATRRHHLPALRPAAPCPAPCHPPSRAPVPSGVRHADALGGACRVTSSHRSVQSRKSKSSKYKYVGNMKPRVWDITDIHVQQTDEAETSILRSASIGSNNSNKDVRASIGPAGGGASPSKLDRRKSAVGGGLPEDFVAPDTVTHMKKRDSDDMAMLKRRANVNPARVLGIEEEEASLQLQYGVRPVAAMRKSVTAKR